jgi:hypothetical protein
VEVVTFDTEDEFVENVDEGDSGRVGQRRQVDRLPRVRAD